MRLEPKERTEHLLDAALRLAERSGWQALTRDAIATEAGVSFTLVTHRLGTMDAIRRSVMRHAVVKRCVPVVAQGLALGDAHARRADDELKAACAAWVGH